MMSKHGYLRFTLFECLICTEGWGSASPHYILEHGAVEFAGGIQGDPSIEEDFDEGKRHRDKHHHAINKLVEMQVWVP